MNTRKAAISDDPPAAETSAKGKSKKVSKSPKGTKAKAEKAKDVPAQDLPGIMRAGLDVAEAGESAGAQRERNEINIGRLAQYVATLEDRLSEAPTDDGASNLLARTPLPAYNLATDPLFTRLRDTVEAIRVPAPAPPYKLDADPVFVKVRDAVKAKRTPTSLPPYNLRTDPVFVELRGSVIANRQVLGRLPGAMESLKELSASVALLMDRTDPARLPQIPPLPATLIPQGNEGGYTGTASAVNNARTSHEMTPHITPTNSAARRALEDREMPPAKRSKPNESVSRRDEEVTILYGIVPSNSNPKEMARTAAKLLKLDLGIVVNAQYARGKKGVIRIYMVNLAAANAFIDGVQNDSSFASQFAKHAGNDEDNGETAKEPWEIIGLSGPSRSGYNR